MQFHVRCWVIATRRADEFLTAVVQKSTLPASHSEALALLSHHIYHVPQRSKDHRSLSFAIRFRKQGNTSHRRLPRRSGLRSACSMMATFLAHIRCLTLIMPRASVSAASASFLSRTASLASTAPSHLPKSVTLDDDSPLQLLITSVQQFLVY